MTLDPVIAINAVNAVKDVKNRLQPISKVDHMNTRTTRNTNEIAETAERNLKRVLKDIVNFMDKNPRMTTREIRNIYKIPVGTEIAQLVRESYLGGHKFIEGFSQRSLELTPENVRKMNDLIKDAIDRFWFNFEKERSASLETPIGGAGENWITVNGTPVLIEDGQSKGDAISKAFGGKSKKSKSKKSKSKESSKSKSTKEKTKPDEPKESIMSDADPITHDVDPNLSTEDLKKSADRNKTNIQEHQKAIQDSAKYSELDYSTTGMSESEIQRGITETFDPHSIAYSEDPTFQHSTEDLKTMWQKLGEENPDLRDRFIEIERGTVRGNEETRQLFEKSKTFFRGTDTNELDGYLSDGLVGSKKFEFEDPDEPFTHKFDFTAVTPHREISGYYGNGVTIEFNGDGVRKHGTPVKYDHFWRDFGAKSESVDGGMHTKYMDHAEVRMPTSIPLEDLKIENIYIDKYAFDSPDQIEEAIKKYSKLGNVIFEDD